MIYASEKCDMFLLVFRSLLFRNIEDNYAFDSGPNELD